MAHDMFRLHLTLHLYVYGYGDTVRLRTIGLTSALHPQSSILQEKLKDDDGSHKTLEGKRRRSQLQLKI